MEERNGNGGSGSNGTVQRPPIHATDTFIPEHEALKILRSSGIKWLSLKKYAESQNAMKKRHRKNMYSRSLIEDLSTQYFTKTETMRLLGYKKSGLHYWMKNGGIESITIGNVTLIKKEDVMAKVRGAA